MAKNFKNSKKKKNFLESIPSDFIADSNIAHRCKFNFSYIDINQTKTDVIDWNEEAGNSKLVKLVNKIKDYSREPLQYWERQKIGKGSKGKGRQHCLEVYGDFPSHSSFSPPAYVPEDVLWARFRIDNETRLAGFVLPECFKGKDKDGYTFDVNTFYVVFLDDEHAFYPLKKK